jgi:deoxyribose-phosphate aldolase
MPGNINLYAPAGDLDDAGLAGLCRLAAERGLASVAVDEGRIVSAWKWLEKSSVALVGRIDMLAGIPSVSELFQRVKAVYSAGAKVAELAPPPDFYGDEAAARECLSTVCEAKGPHSVKVCLESAFIDGIPDLRRAAALLAASGVDCVKTASGLYSRSSSIGHLNAVLEAVGDSGAGVDFLFEPASAGRFVVDDAFRLAAKVRGPDFLEKFCVSRNSKLLY